MVNLMSGEYLIYLFVCMLSALLTYYIFNKNSNKNGFFNNIFDGFLTFSINIVVSIIGVIIMFIYSLFNAEIYFI